MTMKTEVMMLKIQLFHHRNKLYIQIHFIKHIQIEKLFKIVIYIFLNNITVFTELQVIYMHPCFNNNNNNNKSFCHYQPNNFWKLYYSGIYSFISEKNILVLSDVSYVTANERASFFFGTHTHTFLFVYVNFKVKAIQNIFLCVPHKDGDTALERHNGE